MRQSIEREKRSKTISCFKVGIRYYEAFSKDTELFFPSAFCVEEKPLFKLYPF